jgi:hypothetical protein
MRSAGGNDVLTLIRFVCRLALAAAALALLALWIEPRWVPEHRTLELRVRHAGEVLQAARSLGARARSNARKDELPAVSSAKNGTSEDDDQLTDEDRRMLQRLIEEKLRE